MSIQAITFELDAHTIQIVNGDICIWIGHPDSDPDIVFSLEDMRRVLSTATMLIKETA